MSSVKEKQKQTAKRLGLDVHRIPHHIAIIMDGNGRWARQKGLPRIAGHHRGAETAEEIAHRCVDFGIESLTLYSFSMENWKRPKAEVNALMELYTQHLIKMQPKLMKNNVRLIHLGRLAGLPAALRAELTETTNMTSTNTGMILALALNYGGRAEIVDAAREIARQYKSGRLRLKDIDEACVGKHLCTKGLADPDLLIRTANEMRVSNFLLWQISYSEFYVTETLWPDFNEASLKEAILVYAKRDRRFGTIEGTSKQQKQSSMDFSL
jgi:undecaprenyl diphosphate synthase